MKFELIIRNKLNFQARLVILFQYISCIPNHFLCLFFSLQTNPKLYLNLLELEFSGDLQQNEAEIIACFDRALNSPMPLESRVTFSQRKVEFLEDFGSDINV